MNERREAVPVHVIHEKPEGIPDNHTELRSFTQTPDLEVEFTLEGLHVDPPAVGQPSVVIVELSGDFWWGGGCKRRQLVNKIRIPLEPREEDR